MDPMSHSFTLGPGGSNVDIDEINAQLAHDRANQRPYDKKNDKRMVCAIPAHAILGYSQRIKEDATVLLKEERFAEALEMYHRGIWLLMDGNEDFRGDLDGVTKENTGRGHGFSHLTKDGGNAAAKEAEPLRFALHSNLALCALKLKRWKAAEVASQFVVMFDSTNVKAWYRLAQAFEGQCELVRARDALSALLEIDPSNAAALDFHGRLQQEAAREKKKEKKLFGSMFEKMADQSGEVLYRDEDVRARQRRERAQRRLDAVKRGPNREVLELSKMTEEELAHAEMRHMESNRLDDVVDICKKLPHRGAARVRAEYMDGATDEEVKALAEVERLCAPLDDVAAEKLRAKHAEGVPLEELKRTACDIAIKMMAKLLDEDYRKECAELLKAGECDSVMTIIADKQEEAKQRIANAMVPADERSAILRVKELEERQAPVDEIITARDEARALREARLYASLLPEGRQRFQDMEDSGATKNQLSEFLGICERGAIERVFQERWY